MSLTIGTRVRVKSASDETMDMRFMGKVGTITGINSNRLTANTGKDPLWIVYFEDGGEESFWTEELEKVDPSRVIITQMVPVTFDICFEELNEKLESEIKKVLRSQNAGDLYEYLRSIPSLRKKSNISPDRVFKVEYLDPDGIVYAQTSISKSEEN